MAQVLVTYPDEYAERIVCDLCAQYHYQWTVLDPDTGEQVSNPETPFEFMSKLKIKWIKDNMKAHEVPDLAKADRQARVDEIDSIEITIEIVG